ncbi:hypothetical protein RHJ63_06565 [Thermosynechococcus sp. JY1334]|uniref:hypothetical protein n=1 Tax=unclassified Thermosynechococcus TaxID=2622553 RepID=UPI0026741F75|nr:MULTISPECIES: hypothetical protein [unclassified Thermosynechococcus]MDR7897972.1 hypothetical protein [Thermosynechococcus sp. JY1332]MDR7905372.1 hypothetical protein [Thermosynechococcus sp. JY1334]MDR7993196.1 hypothetical protein [Thermosynechococcus sp. TG252]WKT85108.1 hypothetical protein QYC30_06535 [Thermosynechococcus sp. JY1339]WNC54050.1 hypothetical protein RHJ31_06520 [Thermosynechococcus sp. JY1331]
MDSDAYLPEILTLLRQLLPLLISLLDDAFALILTRLGCHLPWLEKIMPFVLSGVTLYVIIHGGKVIHEFCQQKWESPQSPNVSPLQ